MVKITTEIDPDLHARLVGATHLTGQNKRSIIECALKMYLEKYEIDTRTPDKLLERIDDLAVELHAHCLLTRAEINNWKEEQ